MNFLIQIILNHIMINILILLVNSIQLIKEVNYFMGFKMEMIIKINIYYQMAIMKKGILLLKEI